MKAELIPNDNWRPAVKIDPVQATLHGLVQTFEKMLHDTPAPDGAIDVRSGSFYVEDTTAIIPLVGTARGAMLVSMPDQVACKAYAAFTGCDCAHVDDDVLDGLKEIVNIAAGAAAARMVPYKVGLGLPTVMSGQKQRLLGNPSAPWHFVPMKSKKFGNFWIAITLEEV